MPTKKKTIDLSKVAQRIAHRSLRKNTLDQFDKADEILGLKVEEREKLIKRTYVLTEADFDRMKQLKKRLYKHQIETNLSHIIKLSLLVASELSDDELQKAALIVPKPAMGRPKNI